MIKALLVDDEERMLEVLGKNIHWKECGVQIVLKANNMDDALRYCEKYKPQLIITDIEMPDGTGLELMETVLKKSPEVAFLCVTCHPEFEYMRKAMQLGSVDYILKPVVYEELEGIVRKMTSRIQENDAGVERTDMGEMSQFYYDDDKIVMNAQRFIKKHLGQELRIQTIADHLNCSTSQLMHVFKRKTDMTVNEYITQERMYKGKQLLKSSEIPISSVAHLCGYDDYSYFTRVFKKEVGVTPKQYREEHRP